jgi:hypothetical protein
MTKLITIAGLLMLTMFAAKAQNRAHIKGKVVDSLSNNALEKATVAVVDLKDSSLMSYTLTLKDGEFALHNLPAEKTIKLVVSYVGYNNFRKIFKLEKGQTADLGAVKLVNKGNMLGEVRVTAEVTPIVVRKDTVEFSAEAFKTPPNAVVEELLKRLPGIQIDMDGSINYNGKKVRKLLIDGKEFFANDPRIASKNLDASLIAKIQVYDDREDDPDHLIPDSKVEKIVNLKFKKALKKSTFGKVKAGGGTRERFDGGLLYNMFRDTLQISLIGIGNNLNRTGFSNSDLNGMGGFNRSGSDNLYNGTVATGGRTGGGIQTVASGGLNINNDYGNKLKLNLLYFYSFTQDKYSAAYSTQRFFGDTTLSSAGNSGSNNKSNRHTISGLVEWKPDTILTVKYTPRVAFENNDNSSSEISNSFNNFVPRLNSNSNNGTSGSTSFQFQHNFSYYRKLHKKGSSLHINHNLNIRPGSGNNYRNSILTSFTAQLASNTFDRFEDNINNSASGGLNINYRYPFTKRITGSINVDANYDRNKGRLLTFDRNLQTGQYTIYIDSLSRDLLRQQYNETIRPELSYNHKEIDIVANLGIQFMQLYNRFNKNVPDINRFETYYLPSVRARVHDFSLSYDVSVRQPSINELLPYRTVYSQLYSSIGNPDLLPTRSHNFGLNYNKYVDEKQFYIYLYSSYSLEQNTIFSESRVSGQGVTTSRPINKSGGYSYYVGGMINKSFKKMGNWQFRFNTNLSNNFRHTFFQVNNRNGFQNTTSLRATQQFTVNWNNKVEFTPNYTVSPNITNYEDVDYNSIKYVSHSVNMPVIIRQFKHMVIEANYDYSYNPLIASGLQRSINLLSLSVARQFQYRDRGEIKLSCYDLLNQNIGAYRFVNGNSTYDINQQILKRYFLLSYSYRFNKIITKK